MGVEMKGIDELEFIKEVVYSTKHWTRIYKDQSTIIFLDTFDFNDHVGFHYEYYTQLQNEYMLKGNVYRYLEEDYLAKWKPEKKMKRIYTYRDQHYIDTSVAEAKFESFIEETYGMQYVKTLTREYLLVDEYNRNIYIDYVVELEKGRVAFEINGIQYHHPLYLGKEKYRRQLQKQNSIVTQGFPLLRFASSEVLFKEKLSAYFNDLFLHKGFFIKNNTFSVKRGLQLYDHQIQALDLLAIKEKACLIVLPTASGKSLIIEEFLEQVHTDIKVKSLVIAPTLTIVNDWKKRMHDKNVEIMTYQAFYNVKGKEYDYIIVDEAHHAVATTLKLTLEKYNPLKLIGITATPERLDQKRIEDIFGEYNSLLSLQEGIEQGILSKIYCYRIKSNIDSSEIRYNGKNYNTKELSMTLNRKSRNDLIVEVLQEYFIDKKYSGIIFCIDVEHCREMERLLQLQGINARAVGGNIKESNHYIEAYQNKELQFLCSCQLLNEGWDAPHTSVLVMARPTMSKALYLQQLGRGMRTCKGKEGVYVIDVVDQYGGILKPWNTNAIFNQLYYQPFGNVLQMNLKGSVIDDRLETLLGLEVVDIETYEATYKNYKSVEETARILFLNTNTVHSWIKKKKIIPDIRVPFGRKEYPLFKEETIEKTKIEYNLKDHNEDTLVTDFTTFIKEKDYTYSYKMIFLINFIKYMDVNGEIEIDFLVDQYTTYYKNREVQGLVIDKKNSSLVKDKEMLKDKKKMKKNLLENPFEKFERKNFILYSKEISKLALHPVLHSAFTSTFKEELLLLLDEHLDEYYKKIGE